MKLHLPKILSGIVAVLVFLLVAAFFYVFSEKKIKLPTSKKETSVQVLNNYHGLNVQADGNQVLVLLKETKFLAENGSFFNFDSLSSFNPTQVRLEIAIADSADQFPAIRIYKVHDIFAYGYSITTDETAVKIGFHLNPLYVEEATNDDLKADLDVMLADLAVKMGAIRQKGDKLTFDEEQALNDQVRSSLGRYEIFIVEKN